MSPSQDEELSESQKLTPVLGRPMKKHVCQFCQKVFWHKGQYNIHIRVHTNERPYSCSICNATFRKSSSLKEHAVRHSSSFVCSHCGKGFVSSYTLSTHENLHLHLSNTQKVHKCPHCEKSYTHRSPLRRHILKIHKGLKLSRNLTCDTCNKTVKGDYSDFMRHYRLHTRQEAYKCTVCTQTFYNSPGQHHKCVVDYMKCKNEDKLQIRKPSDIIKKIDKKNHNNGCWKGPSCSFRQKPYTVVSSHRSCYEIPNTSNTQTKLTDFKETKAEIKVEENDYGEEDMHSESDNDGWEELSEPNLASPDNDNEDFDCDSNDFSSDTNDVDTDIELEASSSEQCDV
ncbi:zinc finger protein 93-like [Mya arenaria]|uniref:zinc finger protein 93-like n=1 Tax=Mya arenaria TaxID=6604 RepID=UPI0022E93EF2|nr:zinc finger protein 93-like [Mya arenaria]